MSEIKKSSLSLTFRYSFENIIFFLTFRRWFEINLVIFFCPGSGSAYDQCGSTLLCFPSIHFDLIQVHNIRYSQ